MIISSMDLFFRRDCAGGWGPEVEAPRFTDVLLSAALGVPKRLEVMAGAVDVLDAAGAEVEVEDSAGLPRLNSPPEGAGAGVEDVAEDDDSPP